MRACIAVMTGLLLAFTTGTQAQRCGLGDLIAPAPEETDAKRQTEAVLKEVVEEGVDYQNANVRDVIDSLFKDTKLKGLEIHPDVQGTVTIRIRGVSREAILNRITRAVGAVWKVDDKGVLHVLPAETALSQRRIREPAPKAPEPEEVEERLVWEAIKVKFIDVAEIVRMLGFGYVLPDGKAVKPPTPPQPTPPVKPPADQPQIGGGFGGGALFGWGGGGTAQIQIEGLDIVIAERRTNTLLVHGTPEAIRELQEIVDLLDIKPVEIVIDLRVIAVPSRILRPMWDGFVKAEAKDKTASNRFRARLMELLNQGKAQIVLDGRLVVENNKPVEIRVAGFTAQVIPRINSDKSITMLISVKAPDKPWEASLSSLVTAFGGELTILKASGQTQQELVVLLLAQIVGDKEAH